ncbi:MAG: glycosyltransferase, partial [Pseudomonadota bacterium]
IAFLTCHLTGTGHLIRTLTLARTAQRQGHDVTLITGGRPLPHIDHSGLEVVQLPPVRVHRMEFTILREPDGNLVTESYMANRLTMLSSTLRELKPDALVTELFPLGRRVLAQEFLAAIEATTAVNRKAAVVCSVRDIPEPKPKRLTESSTHLLKRYHGVLVHGDAAFLPLSTTWPLPDDVAPMIHHVGYVGGGTIWPKPERQNQKILVSVGGGVLGRDLLEIAAQAATQSERDWHLLVGGSDGKTITGGLNERHAAANLLIESARPDYHDLLASAGCSISLCGYNTAVELASCTVPAILVPSEEADESEQRIRAGKMAETSGIEMLRLPELTPQRLAAAADRLASGPARAALPLTGDDGSLAVRTIEQIIERRSR